MHGAVYFDATALDSLSASTYDGSEILDAQVRGSLPMMNLLYDIPNLSLSSSECTGGKGGARRVDSSIATSQIMTVNFW